MLFSLLPNISQRSGRIDVSYYLVSKEHQFWQSPRGKSAFVEVRESSREVPAYHLSEKIQNWCIEWALKKSFTLPTSPLTRGRTGSSKRDVLSQNFSHRGKWGYVSEKLVFPEVHATAKGLSLVLPHPE